MNATPAAFANAADLGGLLASLDREPLREAAQATGAQSLYLDIVIGGQTIQALAPFTLRGSRLFVAPQVLIDAGLVLPANLPLTATGEVALDSIPNLGHEYDPASQRIVLEPGPGLRATQQLGYRSPSSVAVRRDHGLVLDYDSYARSFASAQTLSVGTGLRWFGHYGSVEMTGVSRFGDGGSDAYQRLDTRWSYSDPQRLWTWTVGDLVSGGLAWTRPVRMGGVQWRRNFGVRPDLIVYPVPQFAASAAVPSSVELYVNNVRQFGQDVQPGPFVINEFPRVVGAGQAVVVVTDALGRATQTSVPLYVDYQRLARGLSDFSVEAGVLRSGFGRGSSGYDDDPAASASWRRGVRDDLTIEMHGELGRDLRAGGAGLAWSPLARYGVVTASYARSSRDRDDDGSGGGDGSGSGHQQALGYQWFGQHAGIDLYTQRASAAYRDLGTVANGSVRLRTQERASMWLGIPRGSLSMTWLRYREQDDAPSRTVSVGLSQTLGRVALSANAFDDDRNGRGVSLSLSVALGRDMDGSLSIDHGRGRNDLTASVRRGAPYAGGWGWEAIARDDGEGQLSSTWRGRAGELWLGVDRAADRIGAFAQANGSMVWMGGQVFASRRIGDSFAVVSTAGTPDVPILYENRVAGRTNAEGYLLLGELRSWQRNRIAIDPDGLAANLDVPTIERLVTPADRGGVRVQFELAPIRTVTVMLRDGAGQPVQVGTRVERADGREAIVGFDGELWLERYTDGETLRWTRAGIGCLVTLPVMPNDGSAPPLASPSCRPEGMP